MSAALAQSRLKEVLRIARLCDASDVHLSPGAVPVFRIDGVLAPQQTLAIDSAELECIAASALPERALQQYAKTGDAGARYTDEDFGTIRVHFYRSSHGSCLALRLLAKEVPSCEQINMPPVVQELVHRPHGLVVFAGPTGSGKTTALAALIAAMNRRNAQHIITIEDPIEYEHRSDLALIHQREIGRDAPSFADAVRGALRSDPDVLLIGEMRDARTMHAALTAAETGHLVLTTLHTSDAPQTVDRIVSMFAGALQDQIRIQLAQSIVAVVCMRLLPRAHGRGRRSACEVMIASDAVRALIRDGKPHQLRNVIATSRHIGMQTLEAHLSALVLRDEITRESALSATDRGAEITAVHGAAL